MNGVNDLDERTDYYSLGIIYYYMLHGKYPIDDAQTFKELDDRRKS